MIWLDNTRIVAIFAVILLHVAASVVLEAEVGSAYWWFGNLYDSLVRWCVPVFIMVSGALLLDPQKQEDLKTFYTKRLSRILIPLLFWSVFFLLWQAATGLSNGNAPTSLQLLKLLLAGTPYYHMWFLYMITGLYLFTPFFRKIIQASTREELVVLVALAFVLAAASYAYQCLRPGGPALFVDWFLWYIPFFFLGHLIHTDRRTPSRAWLSLVFLLSAALTASGCYLLARYADLGKGLYFYGYLSVTVIPMSISVMYLLKYWERPILNTRFTRTTASLTFGIYLIHPAIWDVLHHYWPQRAESHSAILIPLAAITIFSLSLPTAWLIQAIPPLKRTI